jgi:hypothetical protein
VEDEFELDDLEPEEQSVSFNTSLSLSWAGRRGRSRL